MQSRRHPNRSHIPSILSESFSNVGDADQNQGMNPALSAAHAWRLQLEIFLLLPGEQ
jgi:hypothetical protein